MGADQVSAPGRAPAFRPAAAEALKNPQLRANFRRAMDGLMAKRAALFSDPVEWRDLRALGAAIRARTLAKLPELLEMLEKNCAAKGIHVRWAETTEEANGIVLEILKERGVTRVVKGKSMVSEEMHLNDFLEERGIESLESDLGEYIIQLDGETPSHIIMPAIHKNKQQIAKLFGKKIREAKYTEDVDELTAIARRVLRKKFFEAEAGISGVNFAVAQTGTLCLVENENLEDVPPLYSLLTRSATGQVISTYFNMITGPRGPGEKDGPTEVYLVILDNERSRIFSDVELSATLRCIRCGACMNHCPVYTRIGGHAYEAVYPGPIGKILTPQTEGVARRHDLAHASSLCGACVEACPVEIPIAELLVRLRREATHKEPGSTVLEAGQGRSRLEDAAWALWEAAHRHPFLYRLMGFAASRLRRFLPSRLPVLSAWTWGSGGPQGPPSTPRLRATPRPARRTLHELARKDGVDGA